MRGVACFALLAFAEFTLIALLALCKAAGVFGPGEED